MTSPPEPASKQERVSKPLRIAIVGAGIFGVTAARTLRERGHDVSLFDPGPLPHALAESTDISKIVRLDYGVDEDYLGLMENALEGWRAWNKRLPETLFHETGVAFLSRAPMRPGTFEYESYVRLLARGYAVERLDSDAIRRRFPAWSADLHVDGYWNPVGGYVESGRLVARLLEDAERLGVKLFASHPIERIETSGTCVTGIVTKTGELFRVDCVVVAAGSWTSDLVPAMRGVFRSVGQPVFHLKPASTDVSLYEPARFPVFGADISRTGYYGFPIMPNGILKIANHGVGRPMHPESPERVVTDTEIDALQTFVAETFPALASAPIAFTRVCVYCDTWDEHFWIAQDPDCDGLVVASGGSGHAFKFAPVLGDLIADATLGIPNHALHKFRWRPEVRLARGEEAARHHGERRTSDA